MIFGLVNGDKGYYVKLYILISICFLDLNKYNQMLLYFRYLDSHRWKGHPKL